MKAFGALSLSATILFTSVVPVFAADYIGCESKDDRRTYCDIRDARGSEVELSKQFSKSPCVAGSTWGVDGRGVWVDRGCRAEFRVARRYDRGSGYDHRDSGYEHLQDERRDLEAERLALERERLELEKQKAAAQAPRPDVCPPRFRPGRCTDKQRKHGCRDMRTAGGLGCMTS